MINRFFVTIPYFSVGGVVVVVLERKSKQEREREQNGVGKAVSVRVYLCLWKSVIDVRGGTETHN